MVGLQCLTFTINDQNYAIAVKSIEEILPIMWITQLADFPSEIEGCIHLRGKWIPVTDLRKRLGLLRESYLQTTKIAIVCLPRGLLLGVIIDHIDKICEVDSENYEINSFLPQKNILIHSIFLNQNGVNIQLIELKNIIPDELQKQLLESQNEK